MLVQQRLCMTFCVSTLSTVVHTTMFFWYHTYPSPTPALLSSLFSDFIFLEMVNTLELFRVGCGPHSHPVGNLTQEEYWSLPYASNPSDWHPRIPGPAPANSFRPFNQLSVSYHHMNIISRALNFSVSKPKTRWTSAKLELCQILQLRRDPLSIDYINKMLESTLENFHPNFNSATSLSFHYFPIQGNFMSCLIQNIKYPSILTSSSSIFICIQLLFASKLIIYSVILTYTFCFQYVGTCMCT